MIAFTVHQPLTLIIVGGIFVMEASSVILQVSSFKLRGGKRIFRMSPIHHHFELKGWHENMSSFGFGSFAYLRYGWIGNPETSLEQNPRKQTVKFDFAMWVTLHERWNLSYERFHLDIQNDVLGDHHAFSEFHRPWRTYLQVKFDRPMVLVHGGGCGDATGNESNQNRQKIGSKRCKILRLSRLR